VSAVSILVAVLSLVVVVGGWILYQLVLQSGRLSLRVEEIEGLLKREGIVPEEATERGLPAGSVVHDFELPVLTGGTMTLSQWRGRRVRLIFFSPTCGYCKSLLPDLARQLSNQSKDLPVTLIVSTGGVEQNRQLFQGSGVSCPVLVQEQMEVAALYRITGTPMGYLIDERGATVGEAALGGPSVLALAGMPRPVPSAEDEVPWGNGRRPPSHGFTRTVAGSRLVRDGLKPGTPAPPFELPQLDGSTLSLQAYHGQKVVVVFSDPKCGPCTELLPQLEKLHRRSKDVRVLMISRGDVEANRQKAAEHGVTFPVALQRHWEISRAYGMFATPIAYLVDELGVIASDVAVGSGPILSLFSRRTESVASARAAR